MNKIDFFSGETALDVVSPPASQTQDEIEAANMASFGTYNFGGPPVSLNPAGQGYYGGQQQQFNYWNNPGFGYGQPQGGYGFGQYMNSPTQGGYGYNYQQFMNSPNPAFQFMHQQQYQNYQPMKKDVTVHIDAFNPGGNEYLPPADYEEKIFDLEWKFWNETQEKEAKRILEQPIGLGQNYYGYGYYSTPYNYNMYSDNPYINQLKELQEQARQSRINLNIRLSRLAHNFLGDGYTDEQIEEIYTGKDVVIPGISTVDLYDQQRFANLIPFDNSQMYREYDKRVSDQFHKRIKPTDDMNTAFENLALVAYDYEMEDEMHRRRQELKGTYDSNAYKLLVRQKAIKENLHTKINESVNQVQDFKDNLLGSGLFPTLSQHATLADDGTLNITYSLDNNNVIQNQNESQYQKERARFNAFLNSIPSSLGGG